MDFSLVILIVISTLWSVTCTEYSDQWVIETTLNERQAERLATRYGFVFSGQIIPGHYLLRRKDVPHRSKHQSDWAIKNIKQHQSVKAIDHQEWLPRVKHVVDVRDPQWPHMWYLDNNTTPGMGVYEAWNKGYTGEGVTLAVVDDGVEINHQDLSNNIDRALCKDIVDGDNDPSPAAPDRHGTECAGVIAAVNNTLCSIGVSYGSKLAGIRLLNSVGLTTHGTEGQALTWKMDKIRIYSSSWGTTNKDTFDGPSATTQLAIKRGIEQGSNKKGAVYVWAAGNGGSDDNCNCDGYINSIYTIAISSVTIDKRPPWYAEPCSAIMACTYSGKDTSFRIATTETNNGCTRSFTGTSASAPMAAAMIALALQANPQLTWRDVQHLIVDTASTNDLLDGDFTTNTAGKRVSHLFGFGLMNASAMVDRALTWQLVSERVVCEHSTRTPNLHIQDSAVSREMTDTVLSTGCNNTCNTVDSVEHVQVEMSFYASVRGSVELWLMSPGGTRSQLLTKRRLDIKSNKQTTRWTFTSMHYWGESPAGNWTLGFGVQKGDDGILQSWKLIVSGTGAKDKKCDTENKPVTRDAATTRTIGSKPVTTATTPVKTIGNKPVSTATTSTRTIDQPTCQPPSPSPCPPTCTIVVSVLSCAAALLLSFFIARWVFYYKGKNRMMKVNIEKCLAKAPAATYIK